MTLAPLPAASWINPIVLSMLPFKSFQHGSAWIAATLHLEGIVRILIRRREFCSCLYNEWVLTVYGRIYVQHLPPSLTLPTISHQLQIPPGSVTRDGCRNQLIFTPHSINRSDADLGINHDTRILISFRWFSSNHNQGRVINRPKARLAS